MADVSLRWHWAHLPVALTAGIEGCSVSHAGRRLLTISAAAITAVPRNTAMKTDLNVTAPDAVLVCDFYHRRSTSGKRALPARRLHLVDPSNLAGVCMMGTSMAVCLNHNLIEAFILGAAAHVNVEGTWSDDLMKQVRSPGPIQER